MSDWRVFVVGSLNADYRVQVARIPSAGETVIGGEVTVSAGGKGANQAVAAARAGAAVRIVGAIGDDRDGELIRRALADEAIDTRYLRVISGASTGRALVTVDDDGENSIVVSPGANSAVVAADVDAGLHDMRHGDLLLLQLETPLPLVSYAARRATELGGTVVVNAAPVPTSVTNLLDYIDLLVVNEHELTGIANLLRDNQVGQPTGCASDMELLAKGADATVICTAGADGAYLSRAGHREHVEASRVAAVDTTAAGDTFIGYLAAGLASDPTDVSAALQRAVLAAGLTVTRPGAIDSIPYFTEIISAARELAEETSS